MPAELPVASFICAALVLLPLPWHWRAGTVATVAITFWLFFANVINGVNTIMWAGNVRVVVPVWCDISTKFMMGSNVALPAAIFCLCIHLERVSSIRQVRTSHGEKRRRQIIDGLICFGIPVIYMALHYIVQGHRFDIVEDFGCRPTTYVSIPSTFLIWVPPLFFSVGSFVLAALAFRNFWIRRITFSRHLQVAGSSLTPSRYFRLMCMALVQMFLGIAVTSFNMWFTMRGGLRPWTGWADVHVGFSRIALFPTLLIPQQDLTYTYILWWTIPLSSILFFAFFSFGQDAVKEYRACITWVRRNVFCLPDASPDRKGMASLPSYRLPTIASASKSSESNFEPSPLSPAPPYYKVEESSGIPVSFNPSSSCATSTLNVSSNCHTPSSMPHDHKFARDSWTHFISVDDTHSISSSPSNHPL